MLLNRLLAAWYSLAAPAEPPLTAPLWQREVVRRARIISLVMLITIWLAIFPLFVQPQLSIVIILIVVLVIDVLTVILFNRRGKTAISGLIITMTTELGILFSLIIEIQVQGGLTLGIVLGFPLLVQGIVVAASTTRPLIATVVFLVNCLFVIYAVFLGLHAPNLLAYLHSSEGREHLFVVPLAIFQIAFFVIVVWVISANQAIVRADHADVRAKYAEKMALKDHETMLQKKQLEQDVQELTTIIAHIARHPEQEFTIRSTNQLRPLSIALNNLRNRQHKNIFEQVVYQRSQKAASQLMERLESDDAFTHWQPSGTIIDELVHRLQIRERRRSTPKTLPHKS